jgi:hypothetical protein
LPDDNPLPTERKPRILQQKSLNKPSLSRQVSPEHHAHREEPGV